LLSGMLQGWSKIINLMRKNGNAAIFLDVIGQRRMENSFGESSKSY
jgi:hypothetical protein